jgi:hypothetical protein
MRRLLFAAVLSLVALLGAAATAAAGSIGPTP